MNEYDRRCCGWKDERIADLERQLAEATARVSLADIDEVEHTVLAERFEAAEEELDVWRERAEATERQLSATRAELAEARAGLLAKYGGGPYYVSGPYATDGRLIEGTAHDDALVAIYVRVKHLRAALAPVTESASEGGEDE